MTNKQFIAEWFDGKRGQPSADNRWTRVHENLKMNQWALFSYGEHFPLVMQGKTPTGEIAYVLNPRRYSQTTSRHQSLVKQAAKATGRVVILA